jgi:pimeloyl-ACP methyl ester carboxylesterase
LYFYWQTPSTVAERMFEEIEAPDKQLFWLEESAHAPNVDEPERFAEIIEQVVAPLARRPLGGDVLTKAEGLNGG